MDSTDAIARDDWHAFLDTHPIFCLPDPQPGHDRSLELELSTATLHADGDHDYVLSGRRQLMALRDADIIVAAGAELRMTSLWDTKLGRGTSKSYKVLHVPNIDFQIHQLALNPSGKLLAVAGAYQVAVVVLPRAGYTKLVSTSIECKAVQVGQFYHGTTSSVPVCKVGWHPWGEAGLTLMVMTVDGKLREYDISADPEEPQQVLSFIPEKKSRSFVAQDPAEREVTSFTLGKGRADWGPLTVYALTRSGDIYAICPYMPRNASVPTSFIHALDCFIAAKQEYAAQDTETTPNLSTLYDYQRKYVSALIKQLPPGSAFPAVSCFVSIHPPTTMKNHPLRQGPFLLQPSPRSLEGSEGGDATDITYLAFADDSEDECEGGTERLGIIVITCQDGKVDVCLDVEKVEARWESRQDRGNELPMLAVYETIDLGVISMLTSSSLTNSSVDLLQASHPVILPDPIHDDTIYVYHAFGVHSLEFGDLLGNLTTALCADDDGSTLTNILKKSVGTQASAILNTFSSQRRCSNPVTALCVSNDVYLSYGIIMLTSVFRVTSIPLSLQATPKVAGSSPDASFSRTTAPPALKEITPATLNDLLTPMDGPPAYFSLLSTEPFVPPAVLSRPPMVTRLSSGISSREFMLTPDTLRHLETQVTSITTHIREVIVARKGVEERVSLQEKEFARMQVKCGEMLRLIELLKERVRAIRGARETEAVGRVERLKETHKELMKRADKILQALINGASPGLSECEAKWFEELGRMKAEVIGAGKFDEESLKARTALLKREYERIMPSLKEVAEKEEQRRKRVFDNSQSLGVSQAFELGERSNIEKTKIVDLEREIVKMASQMRVSLGQAPQQDEKEDNQGL